MPLVIHLSNGLRSFQLKRNLVFTEAQHLREERERASLTCCQGILLPHEASKPSQPAEVPQALLPPHPQDNHFQTSKGAGRFKLLMKDLCVFNPQSLAGFGPHAKVRFCRSAAHGQAFKVKPDLTQHLLPTEDPLCTGQKAGLLTVAFKTPGYLMLAACDLAPFLCLTSVHADSIPFTPSSAPATGVTPPPLQGPFPA